MPLTIRPIADGDVEAVVSLWTEAGLTVPHNDPYEDIRFCRQSAHAEVLLGFDGVELAAAVMVGHDGHRGWYYYVGVSPSRQGRGTGREIMEAAESWLIERGVGKAQLMIRRENSKVRDFYHRLGYVEEDRLVMAKRFRPVPDWSTGRVETQVIHLEMRERPSRPPAEVPETGRKIALRLMATPSTAFYRFLYDSIGEDWVWVSRRMMRESELSEVLNRAGAEYHLLSVDEEPAGLCELTREDGGRNVELAYFGLRPEFIGLGLGRYFIDAAVDLAWQGNTERVWVHTCDLDHPRALANYRKAGFVPFARELEVLPDPRQAGMSLPPAAEERGHGPDSLFSDKDALERLPEA